MKVETDIKNAQFILKSDDVDLKDSQNGQIKVLFKDLHSLLIGALEGGSNYWYNIPKKKTPTNWNFVTWSEEKNGKMWYYILDYAFNEKGGLIVTADEDDKKYELNLETIASGLKSFYCQGGRHWNDFIKGNHDAITSDVFFQYCLFDDIVYG